MLRAIEESSDGVIALLVGDARFVVSELVGGELTAAVAAEVEALRPGTLPPGYLPSEPANG